MIDERLEQALRSNEPVSEVRNLALQLFAEGRTREAVLELFELARQQLRKANRETDEDVVMDVMDFLVGWCSPHMSCRPNNRPPAAAAEPSASRPRTAASASAASMRRTRPSESAN